mgnify:CR=1 FL=1
MKLLRQTAAAVSVSALAVLGLQMSAGAAVPSISASDSAPPSRFFAINSGAYTPHF